MVPDRRMRPDAMSDEAQCPTVERGGEAGKA